MKSKPAFLNYWSGSVFLSTSTNFIPLNEISWFKKRPNKSGSKDLVDLLSVEKGHFRYSSRHCFHGYLSSKDVLQPTPNVLKISIPLCHKHVFSMQESEGIYWLNRFICNHLAYKAYKVYCLLKGTKTMLKLFYLVSRWLYVRRAWSLDGFNSSRSIWTEEKLDFYVVKWLLNLHWSCL